MHTHTDTHTPHTHMYTHIFKKYTQSHTCRHIPSYPNLNTSMSECRGRLVQTHKHPYTNTSTYIMENRPHWNIFLHMGVSLFSNQQINLSLLLFSLAGFLLPGYLFYHRRNLMRDKAEREKEAANQSASVAQSQSENGHLKNPTNGNIGSEI